MHEKQMRIDKMKMSDKFQLPVDCFVSTVKLNVGCSLSFLNVESASGKDHNKHSDCEFVEHAINNHDRITEENAKLREFVESLQLDVSNEIKLEQLLEELEK